MNIVYAPGCWDLLHVGHVNFLATAKGFGDRLIVGVPSDGVIEEDKGRPPIITLRHRLTMVQELKCVDAAVPYYHLEFLTHIDYFRPDVFAVGEFWGTEARHIEAEELIAEYGGRIVRIPYSSDESTTRIIERIRST